MAERNSEKIDPEILGARIREMRRRKGLKQSAFVGELISSGYISLIEQGKRIPSTQALAFIAEVLGVSVAELTKSAGEKLDPEQVALLAQTEVLISLADYSTAKETLSRLNAAALSSLQGRLLAVELDYGLGNYIAADMPIKDLVEEAVSVRDWEISRRAVIACGRISDRLDTTLESTIFLGQVKQKLGRIADVDPLLMTQLTASIADRLCSLGDVVSAQKLLNELDELLPKVLDRRGRGSALWVQTNVAYDTGNYEMATKYAEQARKLFSEELDTTAVLLLQILHAEIVANYLPEGDSRIAKTEIEISQLLQQRTGDSESGTLRALQLVHADLLIRLGAYVQAEQILTELVAQGRMDPENLTHVYLQLGSIRIELGDSFGGQKYLNESWALVRNMEPVSSVRRLLVALSDLYQRIGDQGMVIEVLRAISKPVGDLSSILSDEN